MSRRTRLVVIPLVVIVVVFAALVIITRVTGQTTAESSGVLTITESSCGQGWSAPSSGTRVITVNNASTSLVDVNLVNPSTSWVYGEIEAIGPLTNRTMTATLPPGHYQVQCTYPGEIVMKSKTVAVTGAPVTDAHPYLPVTIDEMNVALDQYRSDVTSGLNVLSSDTDMLRSDIDQGELSAAKQQWLVAHLDYERLGAAYDTFGDFDDAINGRPNGLPGGVGDPNWTGFFRLEYGLWNNQPRPVLQSVADQLDSDVHGLVQAFPQQQTDPNDISLRTHEILENTLQFELTGETDQGSHTNLATARANVTGTEVTLSVIAPLLQTRAPQVLAAANAGLQQLGATLDSFQNPDGSWMPLDSLTTAQRQVLDSDISSYLETVSPVPDLLELPIEQDNP